MNSKKFFTTSLLSWNLHENFRKMPWKGEKDPYKIWISEIILQQTRVQQGLAYYERFIKAFPDIKSLAMAPEQKIFKLWEGLGYYTRCRNLIATAKYIHENLKDEFPKEYEEILSLKGIGTYTASAISSFAFNKPFAVLDGNVFRVLSRFFGIEIPVNTTSGKKYFEELARILLDKKKPAEYNQAIMDFGAVVCKPALPLCSECPLQKKCIAYLENKVSVLPVNEKKIKLKERYFNYLIIEFRHKFYVRKRIEKDIWNSLYEFILIETQSLKNENEFLNSKNFLSLLEGNSFEIKSISKIYSQKLTHQQIKGRLFHLLLKKPLNNTRDYQMVTKNELKLLPFPKLITSYLTDKNVSLNLL